VRLLLGEVALGDQEPACVLAHLQNLRFLGSPREKKMSNRAVTVQSFDAKDPFAGLALVTKPVPKAEAGHVVVQITLRPVNPIDLNHMRYGSNGFFTPGAEGFGIIQDVSLSILLFYFHAIRFGIRKSPSSF
jgi:hypothetical protein